jgi:hypothetical protein
MAINDKGVCRADAVRRLLDEDEQSRRELPGRHGLTEFGLGVCSARVDQVKYRLYIDEVGNSDMGASQDPNHRYLSLTGVILELGYVDEVVHGQLENLKRRFFGSHADEPVILHRKELVNRKPPFEMLRNPETEAKFNLELLRLLREFEYTVITTVIDKLELQQRYQGWRFDPYHYCLHVILERYVM